MPTQSSHQVLWWRDGAPERVSNSTHDSLQTALAAVPRHASYLVFQRGADDSWEMLPYGAHRMWSVGTRAYEARWILAVILLVAGLHLASQWNPQLR